MFYASVLGYRALLARMLKNKQSMWGGGEGVPLLVPESMELSPPGEGGKMLCKG